MEVPFPLLELFFGGGGPFLFTTSGGGLPFIEDIESGA
jgi:hypothetical protein